MGGGRALKGGSSAEFALRRLGLCRCLWMAAGNASTDGQCCNLHVQSGFGVDQYLLYQYNMREC